MTEVQAVADAKAALTIDYASGDSASSVTQDLTLPATGIDSSTIEWASNDTTVVSTAGVVTRPNIGDANVTLTATITVGTVSDTKDFPITVKAQMTDAQAVSAAKLLWRSATSPGMRTLPLRETLPCPQRAPTTARSHGRQAIRRSLQQGKSRNPLRAIYRSP